MISLSAWFLHSSRTDRVAQWAERWASVLKVIGLVSTVTWNILLAQCEYRLDAIPHNRK